jgi:hypothetical protein
MLPGSSWRMMMASARHAQLGWRQRVHVASKLAMSAVDAVCSMLGLPSVFPLQQQQHRAAAWLDLLLADAGLQRALPRIRAHASYIVAGGEEEGTTQAHAAASRKARFCSFHIAEGVNSDQLLAPPTTAAEHAAANALLTDQALLLVALLGRWDASQHLQHTQQQTTTSDSSCPAADAAAAAATCETPQNSAAASDTAATAAAVADGTAAASDEDLLDAAKSLQQMMSARVADAIALSSRVFGAA